MKKTILLIVLVIAVFLLSACQMPFTAPIKSNNEKYVDSTAHVMQSSSDIDSSLIKTLSNAEKEKMAEKEVLKAIVNARDMQQDLYDEIDNELSRYTNKEVKYQYLKLINDRINSYNTIIHGINGANYDYITDLLTLHVSKTRNGEEKALGEINHVLTRSGALTRYTLLPSENSICPDVEEEEEEEGKKVSKKEKEEKAKALEKEHEKLNCISQEEADEIIAKQRKEIDDLLK